MWLCHPGQVRASQVHNAAIDTSTSCLRTARRRQDSRTVRRGPPAGGSGALRALLPGLRLVQNLLAAKWDLAPPRQLRKLDKLDLLLLG